MEYCIQEMFLFTCKTQTIDALMISCKQIFRNVNNYHLLSFYYSLGALYILSLILTTILHGRYYAHITDEKMRLRGPSNLSEVL